MWNDRKRKKRFIALQRELTQKRVDTMLLKEEEASESNKEDLDKKRSELTEQQSSYVYLYLKQLIVTINWKHWRKQLLSNRWRCVV